MKLALIGRDISHSRSPDLYRELIDPSIHYDLLDFEGPQDLPSLVQLSQRYDAVNITSPYKEHYFSQVSVSDPAVRALGAINTIKLQEPYPATNTDLIAVRKMLSQFKSEFPDLWITLLGSGVMARMTELVGAELGITIARKSRTLGDDMQKLDLSQRSEGQQLVINACSRQFVFQGNLHPDCLFWDYNYHFLPHQKTLPSQVKSYIDGLSLLRLQAESAIAFWSNNNP